MYFVRKTHVFLLLHEHFDVCHYLMILCHFDKMNDKMMFFLLNQYSCQCNDYRLVALDYVRFIHHLGVLIVYDWLWLCKHLSYAFD